MRANVNGKNPKEKNPKEKNPKDVNVGKGLSTIRISVSESIESYKDEYPRFDPELELALSL